MEEVARHPPFDLRPVEAGSFALRRSCVSGKFTGGSQVSRISRIRTLSIRPPLALSLSRYSRSTYPEDPPAQIHQGSFLGMWRAFFPSCCIRPVGVPSGFRDFFAQSGMADTTKTLRTAFALTNLLTLELLYPSSFCLRSMRRAAQKHSPFFFSHSFESTV